MRVHFDRMQELVERVGKIDFLDKVTQALMLIKSLPDGPYRTTKALLLQKERLTPSAVKAAVKLQYKQDRMEVSGEAMLARRMATSSIGPKTKTVVRGPGKCDLHSYDENPLHTNESCRARGGGSSNRNKPAKKVNGKSALARYEVPD